MFFVFFFTTRKGRKVDQAGIVPNFMNCESLSPPPEEQEREAIVWGIPALLHGKLLSSWHLSAHPYPARRCRRLLRTCSACQSAGGWGTAELTQIDTANNVISFLEHFLAPRKPPPPHIAPHPSTKPSSEQRISTFSLHVGIYSHLLPGVCTTQQVLSTCRGIENSHI